VQTVFSANFKRQNKGKQGSDDATSLKNVSGPHKKGKKGRFVTPEVFQFRVQTTALLPWFNSKAVSRRSKIREERGSGE